MRGVAEISHTAFLFSLAISIQTGRRNARQEDLEALTQLMKHFRLPSHSFGIVGPARRISICPSQLLIRTQRVILSLFFSFSQYKASRKESEKRSTALSSSNTLSWALCVTQGARL